tara:strand:+ start:411 stop:650 length:240 start_codon:yes stop_codon:yes gene_type:complete
MPTYHVKCYETVNFTVAIEAESEEQARELAHADINSHEVISESTSEWDIEEVILESEEWYSDDSLTSESYYNGMKDQVN